ncbi:hypothetical protein JYU34_004335 [Plutella xylostella]|uniref:FLYWCH-type domain-containing protein n=1 Tax=Plutella xylostella TaxID=51655 RepID=A0ABQ7QXP8_PLUXY|nr:hypothetical protein JYU34_004335 [Plutella xylostella]
MFIKQPSGQILLMVEGYTMSKYYTSSDGSQIQWRCSCWKSKNCRVSVYTTPEGVVNYLKGQHSRTAPAYHITKEGKYVSVTFIPSGAWTIS